MASTSTAPSCSVTHPERITLVISNARFNDLDIEHGLMLRIKTDGAREATFITRETHVSDNFSECFDGVSIHHSKAVFVYPCINGVTYRVAIIPREHYNYTYFKVLSEAPLPFAFTFTVSNA